MSLIPGALASNDCNGNGVEDAVEIRNGSVPDCNLNGRPDPCELLSVPGMLARGAETPVNAVWPSSLHVIDFDADGRLDALLGDRNGISVLRGGRDGLLPARAYRPPGWPAFGFSVGDWSGDGLLDLAGIVTLGSGLRIWRNTGDDFEPVPPPEQTPEWQMGVLLEDMDLDGRTDLIEAGEFAVRFHWNDDGAFTGSFTDLHHVTWGLSLRALDANGDGAPDLGLDFAGGRQFGTSLNEGGRSFSDIVIRGFPVETRDCAPGDLDADGTIDLLTVEIDGRVAARRLLDMSELREGFLASARVTSLLAADLDGDGADDPILVHPGVHCDGSASWVEVARSSEDWEVIGTATSIPGSVTPGPDNSSVVRPGDFDGDGDLDLVVLAGLEESNPHLIVLENAPAAGAPDADADGIPDGCAGSDCNANGSPDGRDIAQGSSLDCDGDGLPDECEPDCNANDVADDCDLLRGVRLDADRDGIPDECELLSGDCDLNGIADGIDVAAGRGDCDGDGVLDACEIRPGILLGADYVNRIGLHARPRSAVAADLDADGDLDAVFGGRVECCGAEPMGGSLEILLNLEEGRLATTGLHRIDGDPVKLAAGDHDADGDADLFVLEGSSPCRPDARASVLVNRGRGAFDRGPVERLPLDAAALASGDLDGDGRGDLALANPVASGGCVILLLSREGDLHRITVGPEGGATAVAAGDWNRDGVIDLAAASAAGESMYVLVGGVGTAFILGGEMPDGGVRPSELFSRDFDGDGDLDLVRRESELVLHPGEFRFLAGDGVGGFAPIFQAYLRSSSVLFEDMDGDRVNDLIIVGPAPTIGPTWAGVRMYRGPVREEMLSTRDRSDPGIFLGAGPVLPLAGDWNGDGSPDILLADIEERSAALLRNSGSESKFFMTTQVETGSEALALEAADLNGDGDPDLAQASRAQLRVVLNRAGVMVPGEPMPLPAGVKALSTGDLDLDGEVDLVVAAPLRLLLLINEDRGASFDFRSLAAGSNPIAVVALDLDADGDLDIATANLLQNSLPDNVTVFRNLGAGEYGAGRNHHSGIGNSGMAAADMDSDGDSDLVVSVTLYPGSGSLLRNDGNGAFGSPEHLYEGFDGPPLAGDLDGDGDNDLILIDGLFLNSGDGSLTPGQALTRVNETVQRLLDVESDGDLDLARLQGYGQHWLEVERNDGRGFFARATVQDAGQSRPPPGGMLLGEHSKPSTIAAADIDRDGDTDLALGFLERSWITLVWNRTGRAEPDLDGDGMPDGCSGLPVRFRRGDADESGVVDVTDAIRILRWLFLSGEQLPCEKSGDADDNGRIDLTDAVRILSLLFLGGGPLPAPYPECGNDTTPDDLACSPARACE